MHDLGMVSKTSLAHDMRGELGNRGMAAVPLLVLSDCVFDTGCEERGYCGGAAADASAARHHRAQRHV